MTYVNVADVEWTKRLKLWRRYPKVIGDYGNMVLRMPEQSLRECATENYRALSPISYTAEVVPVSGTKLGTTTLKIQSCNNVTAPRERMCMNHRVEYAGFGDPSEYVRPLQGKGW